MKRVKITLPKGGIKESSKVIGETTKSVRLSVAAHTVVYDAEEIIIEGDVTFSGNVNSPKQDPLPFDLEAAKAGAPLVTRDGSNARFIAHVPESCPSAKLIAMIEGSAVPCYFHDNGKFINRFDDQRDLFMAPKPKRTVWVNVYKNHLHETKEGACARANEGCIATVPVEIDA